jgi:hypothetical protein
MAARVLAERHQFCGLRTSGGGHRHREAAFISPAFHERLKKSDSDGDVTVVRTGRPGNAAVIPETLRDGL